MPARSAYFLDVVALLLGEIGLQGEISHADHRVDRRTDLVTHRCEESPLAQTCLFGGILGVRESGRQFVDVAYEASELRVLVPGRHREQLTAAVAHRVQSVRHLLDRQDNPAEDDKCHRKHDDQQMRDEHRARKKYRLLTQARQLLLIGDEHHLADGGAAIERRIDLADDSVRSIELGLRPRFAVTRTVRQLTLRTANHDAADHRVHQETFGHIGRQHDILDETGRTCRIGDGVDQALKAGRRVASCPLMHKRADDCQRNGAQQQCYQRDDSRRPVRDAAPQGKGHFLLRHPVDGSPLYRLQ